MREQVFAPSAADEVPAQARRREFWAGVRIMLPLLLGVAPFGFIFGVLALGAGVPPLEAHAFSLFVFAGSAQFIAAGLIGGGAAPLVVVATIFVVNLRHALYSASLAPHYERLPLRWKLPLSWLLTDEAFATTIARYNQANSPFAHWYAFGSGFTLWVTWQVSTAVGIGVGSGLPSLDGLALDFVLPLTFIAILFPLLEGRPAVIAAAAAGLLAVVLDPLPYKIGLLIAAMVGVAVGLAADLRLQPGDAPQEGRA